MERSLRPQWPPNKPKPRRLTERRKKKRTDDTSDCRKAADPVQLAAYQQLESDLREDVARARTLCERGDALRARRGKGVDAEYSVNLLALFESPERDECRARWRRATDGLHDLEDELLRFWSDVRFDLGYLRRFGRAIRVRVENTEELSRRRAGFVSNLEMKVAGVQSLATMAREAHGADEGRRDELKQDIMQILDAYAAGVW